MPTAPTTQTTPIPPPRRRAAPAARGGLTALALAGLLAATAAPPPAWESRIGGPAPGTARSGAGMSAEIITVLAEGA